MLEDRSDFLQITLNPLNCKSEEMCVVQSVASVVPGLEPLGVDLLAVSSAFGSQLIMEVRACPPC